MRKQRNNAFFKGTLSLSVSVIVTKILGVAFKVPLSYIITDEGMGYFNTAYAIYGLFYILCTAGVPKSLTLVLTSYRKELSDDASDREVLKHGMSVFAKIGAFSTLLCIICAPVLARAVGNKTAYLSIMCVAPSIFFVSLGGVLRGYLNSTEKLTAIAVSQLCEGIIKLFWGLCFALIGMKMNASVSVISALAITGISVGSATSFIYMYIKAFPHKTQNKQRQNKLYSSKDIRRKILKNALPIALSSTLLNLSSMLDLALIIRCLVRNGMSEANANAVYGNYTTLAVPMFTLVISVLTPVATSYMPRLSSLDLSGDRKGFSKSLNALLLITLSVSVPASLAFYFYSFDLLDVLFSLQSSVTGAPMLIALSFGVVLLSTLTVINTALESQRKIMSTVFSLLFGCVVKTIVSYILIAHSSAGILGAPIGTVISYSASLAVSLMILEGSGIRIYPILKVLLLYIIGLVSFYPPYKLIYSTSLLYTSFLSMSLALIISLVTFALLLMVVYLVFTRFLVFKMHKN